MPDPKTIIKQDPTPFAWSEVEVPGGHTLKDGRVIDMNVIVPDGALGYGDKESAALMAGDVVAARSTDSQAGDRAYEEALEQLDTDFKQEFAKIRRQTMCAKSPVFEAYEDRDAAGVMRGMHVLSVWLEPNGKWDKSMWDAENGRWVYPRIDYIEMDEGARSDLFFKYGVTV